MVEEEVGLFPIKHSESRITSVQQLDEAKYVISSEAVVYGDKDSYIAYLNNTSDLINYDDKLMSKYIVKATYDSETGILTELEYARSIEVKNRMSIDSYIFKISDVMSKQNVS